jgi:hypothetical protein
MQRSNGWARPSGVARIHVWSSDVPTFAALVRVDSCADWLFDFQLLFSVIRDIPMPYDFFVEAAPAGGFSGQTSDGSQGGFQAQPLLLNGYFILCG